MKSLREINKYRVSRFLIPLLAVLFVFSISAHNHKIGVGPDSSVHISGSAPSSHHSAEGCSACLLHGNFKLPGANTATDLLDPGQSITFAYREYLIPASFSTLNKPSRAPPLA